MSQPAGSPPAARTFLVMGAPPATGAEGPDRWYLVSGSDVLVGDEPPVGTDPSDEQAAIFLGVLGDRPCWAVDVAGEAGSTGRVGGDRAAPGAADGYLSLFALWGRLDEVEWAVAGRAVQLVEWDRNHRWCGRCGSPTVASPTPGERAKRCPDCGLLAFPRLAPAIIVLIRRGEEVLLARGRNFGGPMYSTLAGFVEPGESLEQAVRREIREEVGVELGDIRYWGSQPWPFPHSLMVGFIAEWAAGDVRPDPAEIADAAWFTPDSLPNIPPPISIARRMIDWWLAGGDGPP